jgi:formyl-CoA transferase
VQTNDAGHGGALNDLRVVEMGVLLAGPFAGQLFADFGAEVIKLEPPGTGDPMREWGREKPHGKSLWWPVVARNKKSVTLNLRTEDGQQIARDLLAESDLLVENFRPGTLERWNLAPEALWEINPRLVVLRVTGFGQTGPMSPQAGYGAIGEAMGGLRYVIGEPDRMPSRAGVSIGDTLAATFGALGALMALHARERTGRGQVVDSAIYEAVLAIMESLVSEYDKAGYVRERTGPILPNVSPSNVYPTSDGGEILIAGNQDTVFRRLAAAMGRPELADDDRYSTHTARGAHQDELDDLIADWTGSLTADQVEALMRERGVPHGKIYRAPDMLADEHFKARDAIVRVAHKQFGDIAMQNTFPKLSETPGEVRWAGPELGEHTDAVLGELLGLGPDRLAQLRDAGVI